LFSKFKTSIDCTCSSTDAADATADAADMERHLSQIVIQKINIFDSINETSGRLQRRQDSTVEIIQ
jgi:hypothetical protein